MKVLAVDDHEVDFWLRHTRGGVGLTFALGLTVMVSVAATDGPGRGAMVAMAVVIVLGTPAFFLLPLRRIIRSPFGAAFFDAWEGFGITALSVLPALDGGGSTPITLGFLMVLVHGATAYPRVGVGMTGVAITGAYLGVARMGDAASTAQMLWMVAGIGVITWTAGAASANYRRQASLARQLALLADRDGLTGCLNHRAFHERVHAESARANRHGHSLSLLLIDVDDFKRVNDDRGHPAGDAMLLRVAEALSQSARDSDLVGRIGGDEFALLLPETCTDEAVRVAERLCATVRSIREPVPITVSIGVGSLPGEVDALTLLAQADVAVYQAKREGRDRACTYDAEALQASDAAAVAAAAAAEPARRHAGDGLPLAPPASHRAT